MTPVLALANWHLAAPFFSPVALTALWVSIQIARDHLRGSG
jgi:hypothetical protein